MVVDAVDAYLQVAEVQMVEIKAVDTRDEVLVIGKGAVVQVHTGHGVGLRSQVHQSLAGHQRTPMGTDTHRVARHVERHVGTGDRQLVGMDNPGRLGLGGVLRHGVVQGNVETGILQTGAIQFNGMLV